MSYEKRWDLSAATPEQALLAVDGSASEETLKSTGESASKLIRAALNIEPKDKVFELGCGVARTGSVLARECAEWHGADISGNMLAVARERLAGFDNTFLHKLNRTALVGIDDNYFDKAYCVAVLIHMDKEDVYLYLTELARVLKPGGILYFDTWNLAHPVGWKRWMMEVNNWDRDPQSERKDVSRNQFCVIEELRLFLEHAGLTEVVAFTDSAWNQVIAAKSLDATGLARHQSHVKSHLADICYTERWNELFDLVLDVTNGDMTHEAAIQYLEAFDDPESVVFRDYLRAQMK